ncbi:MAG TPA: DUF4124 domain-containing protein [Burkholderiales bacterium]|nr:DUF4124 domain-containing protein [Burkholderiales bacterium]
MSRSLHISLILAAVLATAGSNAAAQVYKWVDENGVVNYSNTPPPKKPGAKPPVIVEETISTYTPEKAVTESIEGARKRASAPPPPPPPAPAAPAPAAAAETGGGNRVGVLGPPAPPPVATYDPCANPNDPRCQQIIYAPAPIVVPRRPVQIPPGTVTSNVGPSPAVVPGQPGLNNPQFPQPRSQRPLMHGPDRDRDRDRSGR